MPHKLQGTAARTGTNTYLSPMARQLIYDLAKPQETWSETLVRVLSLVRATADLDPAFRGALEASMRREVN